MKQICLKGTIINNFFEPRSLKSYKSSKSTFMIGSCLEKNLSSLTGFIMDVQGWSNTAKFSWSFFVQSFKIIFCWWWWWTGQVRGAILSTNYSARIVRQQADSYIALISKRYFPRRIDVATGPGQSNTRSYQTGNKHGKLEAHDWVLQ